MSTASFGEPKLVGEGMRSHTGPASSSNFVPQMRTVRVQETPKMIHIYVNYPEPHITIHTNSSCGEIQKHKKEGQRHYSVSMQSLTTAIAEFASEKYAFGADRSQNDMWMEVTLGTSAQELAFAEIFRATIGQRYRRLEDAPVINHC